jgi:hypothetical protein
LTGEAMRLLTGAHTIFPITPCRWTYYMC